MRFLKRFSIIFFIMLAMLAVIVVLIHFFSLWFGEVGIAIATGILIAAVLSLIIAATIE